MHILLYTLNHLQVIYNLIQYNAVKIDIRVYCLWIITRKNMGMRSTDIISSFTYFRSLVGWHFESSCCHCPRMVIVEGRMFCTSPSEVLSFQSMPHTRHSWSHFGLWHLTAYACPIPSGVGTLHAPLHRRCTELDCESGSGQHCPAADSTSAMNSGCPGYPILSRLCGLPASTHGYPLLSAAAAGFPDQPFGRKGRGKETGREREENTSLDSHHLLFCLILCHKQALLIQKLRGWLSIIIVVFPRALFRRNHFLYWRPGIVNTVFTDKEIETWAYDWILMTDIRTKPKNWQERLSQRMEGLIERSRENLAVIFLCSHLWTHWCLPLIIINWRAALSFLVFVFSFKRMSVCVFVCVCAHARALARSGRTEESSDPLELKF